MRQAGIGDIVHYVNGAGNHRPAIVVQVWPQGIDLQVFTGGPYDVSGWPLFYEFGQAPNAIFIGGVPEGINPHEWHWPEVTA
jgi:hypothetical protein